jgi:hypothetical protein
LAQSGHSNPLHSCPLMTQSGHVKIAPIIHLSDH